MPRYNVVFESNEEIYGIVPKAYDWVHYKSILKVKDGGKYPVSLEMTFVPPHPFAFNMPESHSIKGASICRLLDYFTYLKFNYFTYQSGYVWEHYPFLQDNV